VRKAVDGLNAGWPWDKFLRVAVPFIYQQWMEIQDSLEPYMGVITKVKAREYVAPIPHIVPDVTPPSSPPGLYSP